MESRIETNKPVFLTGKGDLTGVLRGEASLVDCEEIPDSSWLSLAAF